MKYSYQWLRELAGTKKTPEELAEFLTMRAFEVESVERVGFDMQGVLVGEVVSLEKHPHADRLRVAQVSLGTKMLQIVCGAPNIAVGQKVAVATEGTRLSGALEIKRSVLRDVESFGMICSLKELGLGEDHAGIFVVPKRAKIGMALRDFLCDIDWLLDIKVLPDRAHDALNHVGMSREIAALEGQSLDYDYEGLKLTRLEGDMVSATIANQSISSRYMGALIHNVAVTPSPLWLRNRLRKLGIRSVNNVVDVTNFVMQELGQPLHVFDWDTLHRDTNGCTHMTVRTAHAKEEVVLLDGTRRILSEEDTIIFDGKNIAALAGIMGAEYSGVTEKTTHIFVESAHFHPVTIRKTRTRLGLRTDASDRFEKSIDPNIAEKALTRALELLAHTAKGNCVQTVDIYPDPVLPKTLSVSIADAEALLGVALDIKMLPVALARMGYGVKKKRGQDILEVTVPTYRLDAVSPEDVIEDIGKLIGYDAVPTLAPKVSLSAVTINQASDIERRLSDAAYYGGFTETLRYSFYSREDAASVSMNDVDHLVLANPMNPEQELMRASLAPNILKSIADNSMRFHAMRLFECGNVYFSSEFQAVHEHRIFSLASFGDISAEQSFFAFKNAIDRIVRSVGIVPIYDTVAAPQHFWHPTQTADIFGIVGNESTHIGRIGEIHPFVLEKFRLKKCVAYCELDIDRVLEAVTMHPTFKTLQKYPEVLRDISLFVPDTVRVKDVLEEISKNGKGLVLSAELFDRYTDKEKKMKSMAFHIRFGSPERTLESSEVEVLLEALVVALEKNIQAIRRTG